MSPLVWLEVAGSRMAPVQTAPCMLLEKPASKQTGQREVCVGAVRTLSTRGGARYHRCREPRVDRDLPVESSKCGASGPDVSECFFVIS